VHLNRQRHRFHPGGLRAGARSRTASVGTLMAFLVVAYLPAVIGGRFPPGEWYLLLAKPEWTPSGTVFGVVWSALYLLIGFAGYLAWQALHPLHRPATFALYGFQLVLNALWSVLFFGLHRPGLALVDLLALAVAATFTTIVFYRIRPAAGLLLLPYLAWLVFAALLNIWIVYLN